MGGCIRKIQQWEASSQGCKRGRYRLAYELHAKNSVRQLARGRKTEFMPKDIVNLAVGDILYKNVEKFNGAQFADDDTDDLHASSAVMLDVFSDDGSD